MLVKYVLLCYQEYQITMMVPYPLCMCMCIRRYAGDIHRLSSIYITTITYPLNCQHSKYDLENVMRNQTTLGLTGNMFGNICCTHTTDRGNVKHVDPERGTAVMHRS